MIPELQKLYYYEIDHAHLDFDSDPVYQEKMARALAELEAQELSPALFSLLDAANQISFTHGFRLGVSTPLRFRLAAKTAFVSLLLLFPANPLRWASPGATRDWAKRHRGRVRWATAPPRPIGPLSPAPILRGPPIRPTGRSTQRRGRLS